MKRLITGFILAAALTTAGTSYAVDSEAGTASSNILTLQDGARPAGMGGAYVAVSDDINALYHNPAGLGFFKESEVSANEFGGFAGLKLSDLAVAIPLGDVTTSNVHQLGTLAFNLATLDYGSEDAFDASGNRIGDLKASDRVYGVGYGKAFRDRGAIGALARVYNLKIAGESASGTSVDLGALYRLVPGYFNVGASARNIGSDVQYSGKTEKAPTEYMLGAALTPLKDALTLALDVGSAADRSSIVRGGAEWHLSSAFALRAGYDSSLDAGSGLSLGAGVQLLDFEVGFIPIDKVGLDYSFTPTDLQTIHRVSLTARIGTQ